MLVPLSDSDVATPRELGGHAPRAPMAGSYGRRRWPGAPPCARVSPRRSRSGHLQAPNAALLERLASTRSAAQGLSTAELVRLFGPSRERVDGRPAYLRATASRPTAGGILTRSYSGSVAAPSRPSPPNWWPSRGRRQLPCAGSAPLAARSRWPPGAAVTGLGPIRWPTPWRYRGWHRQSGGRPAAPSRRAIHASYGRVRAGPAGPSRGLPHPAVARSASRRLWQCAGADRVLQLRPRGRWTTTRAATGPAFRSPTWLVNGGTTDFSGASRCSSTRGCAGSAPGLDHIYT